MKSDANDHFLVKHQRLLVAVSTMSTSNTYQTPGQSRSMEEKISQLAENFQSTIDSVNCLQQTCANLLLDNTKHYQLDVLNRLDTIEKKLDQFNHDQTQ